MSMGGLATSPSAGELKLVTSESDQRDGSRAAEFSPVDLEKDGREPIGAPLETIRSDLLRHGQHLMAVIPEAGAAFVRDALRVLESQVCRVAVVSHVKGGKSSFINALAQKPALLPTDVSPFACTITRVHFGLPQVAEGVAAEFHLFEIDEWERLAGGESRVRNLTHQLVPGFEPELLRGQIEVMRQRAGVRHGAALGEYIGAIHRHVEASPDVLARYFNLSGSDAAEGEGHFAEITRSADLYLEPGPFRLPFTLIETPGINDPFLVRDEVTRQTFESAEIHVVVLNARQPLSTAELAHLRILRGLHKDRIVVFINRIDELGDIVIDTRKVIADVRQALEREFPGIDIPVVAGSTLWGNLALAENSAELEAAVTPSLLAYARHRRVLRPIGLKNGQEDDGASEFSAAQLKRALSVCSGFEEITAALNGVLLRSHTAHLVRQVASYFSELAQLNEASIREEYRRQVEQTERLKVESTEREHDLQRMQTELACIRQIAAEVERRLSVLQGRLNDIVAAQRYALQDGLMRSFQGFTEEEGEKLLNDVGSGRAVRQWRCDTRGLRQTIEDQAETACRRAETQLAQTEDDIFPVLREAMLRRFPYLSLPEPPEHDEAIRSKAPVPPLPDSVTLEGPRGLWSFGKSKGISAEEPDRELERLLREGFVPAIEDLVRTADTRLRQYVSHISDYAAATSVAVMEALRKESDMLIARAAQLLEAQQARVSEDGEMDQRLAKQRDDLVVAEALNRRLSELTGRCSELVA